MVSVNDAQPASPRHVCSAQELGKQLRDFPCVYWHEAQENDASGGRLLLMHRKFAEVSIKRDQQSTFRMRPRQQDVVSGTRVVLAGGIHVVPCRPECDDGRDWHVLVNEQPHYGAGCTDIIIWSCRTSAA